MASKIIDGRRLGLCFLGILIAAFLATATLTSSAYADDVTSDDDTTSSYAGGAYVSIGDSIAAGFDYTTHSYVSGFSIVAGSYPDIVANSLSMSMYPYHAVAYRTNEVLRLMGQSVSDDYYYNYWSSMWSTMNTPSATTVNNAIASAKLVTVELGGNDVKAAPMQTAAYNVLNAAGVSSVAAEQAIATANYGDLMQAIDDAGLSLAYYSELIVQIQSGMSSFNTNFDQIMNLIHTQNPDATVVVVSMYNPYRYAASDASSTIQVGDAIAAAVSLVNSHMETQAATYGYTYLDVTDVESYASALGEVSFSDSFNADPHPTAKGNVEIARGIVNECDPTAGVQTFDEATNPGTLWVTDGASLCSASNPDQVIDIAGGSTQAGANATTWESTGALWQQFYLSTDKDGFTVIRSSKSDKYLGVSAADAEVLTYGTNVSQVWNDGTTLVEWVAEEASDGTYYLRLRGTNLYLDVQGGTASNGANLQLWTNVASNNRLGQQFSLTHTFANGYYILRSADNQDYVADVVASSIVNGANVTLWQYTGARNQIFQIYHLTGDYYKVVASNSWMALDVVAGGTANGTNVTQWSQYNTLNQSWIIESNDDGTYSFKAACSGLYLDVQGGYAGAGVNLQTWEATDNNSGLGQRFVLEATSI